MGPEFPTGSPGIIAATIDHIASEAPMITPLFELKLAAVERQHLHYGFPKPPDPGC
jgi:hypothetical protein